jgi:siderophore synthetase component
MSADPAPAALADEVTAHTLLNCLLREVCGPQRQARIDGDHVVLRLPRHDTTIRVRLRRAALTGAHRFAGVPQVLGPAGWRPIGSQQLAQAIAAELTLEHGSPNEEFAGQVRGSRELIRRSLAARARTAPAVSTAPDLDGDPTAAYLASEQSLLYGHRFHPTPKSRSGSVGAALRYAPEAAARFPLRLLAVRTDLVDGDALGGPALDGPALDGPALDGSALDGSALGGSALLDGLADPPPGYATLPVHPWQYALLRGEAGPAGAALAGALRRGDLLDLGRGGPDVVPTASVRTVYHPRARAFVKLSLSVRITNCVRRNAPYELTGAVALTRLLRPLTLDLARLFPGTVLLAEPAYRTVALPGLVDTLGVIVREGLDAHLRPGVTPLLAAAVADEHGPLLPALLRRAAAAGAGPLDWWDRYVGLLLPPVLYAYFRHGVVTEPHLQNVVVGVRDGLPAQVFLRDLEGVKLLPPRHSALPPAVAAQVCYDPRRGFDRVVYCLLVNHLGEVLARLADVHPALERPAWQLIRRHLLRYAAEYGDPDQLRELLAGAPLPGKANLLTRWARLPDRSAGYLPLPNPLAVRAAAEPPVPAGR